MRIVAFGDSLVAGFGLPAGQGFTDRLQAALVLKGQKVEIVNAGVAGDTSADGLARVDWSIPEGTDGVILEFGANDALRGIDPALTRQALDGMMRRLRERGIPVLICGMQAPPNMGADYKRTFDAIFPALAESYGALLYPFFLEGVAADLSLNQRDGIHPNAAGVKVIVDRMLPPVEALIARAAAPPARP